MTDLTTVNSKSGLRLSPIQLNQSYVSEYNIHLNDFCVLTKDGQPISQTLYRLGGMNSHINLNQDIKDDYVLLLKHIEKIVLNSSNKKEKRLESHWSIIDKNGIEKKVFERFDSPYLVKDSCIYTINNKYYNIETDEFYGYSYSSRLTSKEFIFIEVNSKVLKINKKTGLYEVFE